MTAVLFLATSASCAGTQAEWGLSFTIPSAVSLQRAVNDTVAVEATFPHSGPFRVVLREELSTLTIGNTHVRFLVGTGAAVAVLYKSVAWGSCGLMGVEIAWSSLPASVLADLVVLLPWIPSIGGITVVAQAGFRWVFP